MVPEKSPQIRTELSDFKIFTMGLLHFELYTFVILPFKTSLSNSHLTADLRRTGIGLALLKMGIASGFTCKFTCSVMHD